MPILLLALLTAAADPQPLAPVVVGADAAGKAEAPQLQSLAASSIARSRFQLLDLVDALDPERAAARGRSQKEAEAALAGAEKAYNDLDTQRAGKLADAAVKAFQQTDLSRTWPGYLRARVLKVACLAASEKPKTIKAELERLLAIAPDAELPPAQFAPDLLAFARRTRQAVQSRGDRLEVKTAPDGAEVWVDGRRRGLAPLTVRNLGPGEHLLTARFPGSAIFQQPVSGTVVANLEAASRSAAWAAVEKAAADRDAAIRAAGALAASTGAAQALLVLASRGDKPDAIALELLRVDAGGARVRAQVRGAVPSGQGLAAAASQWLDAALGPDQVQLVPPEAAAARPPPVPAVAAATAPPPPRPAGPGEPFA
ncbi:MAG TPA: PEGA domain-containing protein, partial [Myxococcales bacterium]|nr:PEGA domain-containing protein [Myxococcales bacterium]